VLGWVTVFGRVNHLGAEPGTHAYSAWARRLWVGWNEYPAKAGEVNRHIAWYISPYPWSPSVRWCLAVELVSRDQRRRTGSGSALEALRDDALYKYTYTLCVGRVTWNAKVNYAGEWLINAWIVQRLISSTQLITNSSRSLLVSLRRHSRQILWAW